uniref:Putative Angiomotin n=1 Tax=Daphnia magna TaxID=35525 RepID=A0A0P5IFF6_9CRUS
MSVSNQCHKDHFDGSDGSDSDATTTSSTEHLTREEKLYVLRHTARQEPQGQESKSWQQLQQQRQSRPSCRSCSGLQLAQQQQRSGSVNRLEQSLNNSGGGGPDPASSCRTLIIHGSLSDESWARLAGTGSIPDLGLTASTHYLTSTPKTPPFRPASSDCNDDADDLLLLGSADRRRRRGGHHPPPPPPSPGVGGFTTRSLPRSAKDFSALSTYQRHHPSSHLTSLASLYQEEQDNPELDHHDGCCERRKQLKMLQGLAREMNWSLPVTTTTTLTPGTNDSCYPLSIEESGEGACSALSISDTLLNDHQTLQTPSSYTRDFTYLSKPPPAYPRNKSVASGTTTAAALPVATDNGATNGSTCSSRNSSSSSCRRIKIRRALSRSHPDLSKLGKELGWNKSSAGTTDSSNTCRTLRHKYVLGNHYNYYKMQSIHNTHVFKIYGCLEINKNMDIVNSDVVILILSQQICF